MEKNIYRDFYLLEKDKKEETEAWSFSNFHQAASTIDGMDFLGRNSPLDFRNGTATYKIKGVKVSHWEEHEPEYSVLEVKLEGNESAIGKVEKIINKTILPN